MDLQKGIYTLANDNVYDQVIALINSIRSNYNQSIPICIIPYDDKIQRLGSLVSDSVFLFDDRESLDKWDKFALDVWSNECFNSRQRKAWYHGSNTIRKLCSFDGIFKKFIYIDSDSLVMSSLEDCFNKLDDYDCFFDDWEHSKNNPFLNIDLIKEKYDISDIDVRSNCHCSDFFGSKSTLLTDQSIRDLRSALCDEGDIRFINERGWWDEVYLFSYITFKLNWKVFNYTLSTNPRERTGNIAGVDPFVENEYVLFNKQGLKPIHRIHYMGYSSDVFRRLCKGENTNIPHQEVFLYYRFMDDEEQRQRPLKKANLADTTQRLLQKIVQKIKKS
jgi:hypothetical protein